MAGKLCENEPSCVFFNALSEKDKRLNRFARQATENGREFPGSLNLLCGSCTQTKTINLALSQRAMDLIPH